MRRVLPILVIAFFAGIAGVSRADDVIEVTASLSDESVMTGDVVTMEVNVVSHTDGQLELELPRVDGLTELSRSKSEGTSIQWTNGSQRITKEYTLTIELQAEKAGKLTIPPITASSGKNRGQSRPMVLNVGAEALPANIASAEAGKIAPPEPGEERLFIRYKVDRAEAYVGQQIVLDLDVYALPSMNFAIEEAPPPPSLDGFWKETIDQPQRLTRRIESISGRSYHVYRVWRIALFALEPGERTIPTGSLTYAVNRSIFGGGQRDRRKAPAMKLEILPLPTEGRPAAFSSQNVGQYTLTAALDRDKVPAGKALVLTLSLTGRGNVKNARLPELPPLDGFRVFAPTVTDQFDHDGNGFFGTKRAEILLMPERGGRLEIPSIELSIFNPEEKRYQRLETPTMRVLVEGDPSTAAGETFAPNQTARAPNEPRDDTQTPIARPSLKPLRFRSTLASHQAPPWENGLLLALFFAPPFAFLAIRLGGSLYALSRRETDASRSKAKTRAARERLAKARAAVHAGDTAGAYREMREALLDLGSEKIGRPLRGMTIEEARAALASHGAGAKLVEVYVREMEAADYVQYAPQAIDRKSLEGAADRWESLFSELEALR